MDSSSEKKPNWPRIIKLSLIAALLISGGYKGGDALTTLIHEVSLDLANSSND